MAAIESCKMYLATYQQLDVDGTLTTWEAVFQSFAMARQSG